MIEEKAYAKVNLALEVGNTNEEGYHLVKNVMVPIDLSDTLTFDRIDSSIILLDNTNIPYEKNLVYKAAKLFIDTYKINSGVIINLVKNIPSEAGLAGGSSDAAATLRGLNKLFNVNASLEELANLGAKLGADVPYSVYSKACLCTGFGEKIKVLDIDYPKWDILLVKPPLGCSTKEIYQAYEYKKNNKHSVNKVIDALKENDLDKLNSSIFNDLEAPAFKVCPELIEVKNRFGQNSSVMMSGSGSTFFEISTDVAALEEIKAKFSAYYDTYLIKLL